MKVFSKVTCVLISGVTAAFAVPLGDLKNGVLSADSYTGTGYMLFNPNGLTDRFSTYGEWDTESATHFTTVRWHNNAWHYYSNDWSYSFVPELDDVIVATLEYGNDTVDHLDGENYFLNGIQCGYESGDLVISADQWAGAANNGEFGLAGNSIELHPPSVNIPLGWLRMGVTAPEDQTGTGYLLFAPSTLTGRINRFSGQATNFVAVIYENDDWHYFQNEETFPFTPFPSDILVTELDYSNGTATSLEGQNQLVNGILAGYADGDLVVIASQFNGVYNPGEFGVSGTHLKLNSPHWWITQNIIDPAVIDPNPKGIANVGQAKWMALGAYNMILAEDPQLAADILADLVGDPATHPFSGWPPPGSGEGDKIALALGQLKAIVAPFYNHLNLNAAAWLESEMTTALTRQAGTHFPWGANVGDTENSAATNIGQLKAAFSFRLSTLGDGIDSDADGLPDQWETEQLANSGGALSNIAEIIPDGDMDGDYFSNRFEYLRNTSAVVAEDGQVLSPISWRNEVRADVSNFPSSYGGSITRVGGTNWKWDAGALSAKLLSGDGGVRFKFPHNRGIGQFCGLSALSSGTHYAEIDYAFYSNRGLLSVRELGVNKANFGFVSEDAILEIRRTGTVVKYYVDSILVRTSGVVADRPLFADCALLGYSGSAITHAGHYGFSDGDLDQDTLPDYWELAHAPNLEALSPDSDPDHDFLSSIGEFRLDSDPYTPVDPNIIPKPIQWENLVNTEAGADIDPLSSSLTKVSGTGWNGGANSVGRIAGDGSLFVRVSNVINGRLIGLSADNGLPADNPDSGYTSIDYALNISGHTVRFFENGSSVSGYFPINPYDTLEIRRNGDTITYHINGVLKGTSSTTTTLPLFVDASIYTTGVKIDHVAAYGMTNSSPDADSDGVDDWFENLTGLDSANIDSDNDGISDGDELFLHRSNPLLLDSDGDYILDSFELAHGLSLFDPAEDLPDADSDGLPDVLEIQIGSDPQDKDSDDDYVLDGVEFYGL